MYPIPIATKGKAPANKSTTMKTATGISFPTGNANKVASNEAIDNEKLVELLRKS